MDDIRTDVLFTDIPAIIERAKRRKGGRIGEGVPTCMQTSASTEWYTPADYVDAARDVMGGIDVDPASNPMANKVVKATIYYTKETNGLDKVWSGRVWLNPPYGYDGPKCNPARWSARLIEQYQSGNVTQAVLLVNASVGQKWFQPLGDYPICFPDHRIKMYTPDGSNHSPTHCSALVYLGTQVQKFNRVFRQFGRVMCDMNAGYAPPSLWNMEVSA